MTRYIQITFMDKTSLYAQLPKSLPNSLIEQWVKVTFVGVQSYELCDNPNLKELLVYTTHGLTIRVYSEAYPTCDGVDMNRTGNEIFFNRYHFNSFLERCVANILYWRENNKAPA